MQPEKDEDQRRRLRLRSCVLPIRVPLGGPFIGVQYYIGDLKRDPNLENCPYYKQGNCRFYLLPSLLQLLIALLTKSSDPLSNP